MRTEGKWGLSGGDALEITSMPKGSGYIVIANAHYDKWMETCKDYPMSLKIAQANAEFICKAVNSHTDLLEACKALYEDMSTMIQLVQNGHTA